MKVPFPCFKIFKISIIRNTRNVKQEQFGVEWANLFQNSLLVSGELCFPAFLKILPKNKNNEGFSKHYEGNTVNVFLQSSLN